MASSSSCPIKQNNGYFLNFKAGEKHPSPMLLVSVVGPHYLQVFWELWNGSHACVDPLTDPLSLLFVPHDPKFAVKMLYSSSFSAIHYAVDELEKYYQSPDKYGHKGPYYKCNDLEYKGCVQGFK